MEDKRYKVVYSSDVEVIIDDSEYTVLMEAIGEGKNMVNIVKVSDRLSLSTQFLCIIAID